MILAMLKADYLTDLASTLCDESSLEGSDMVKIMVGDASAVLNRRNIQLIANRLAKRATADSISLPAGYAKLMQHYLVSA